MKLHLKAAAALIGAAAFLNAGVLHAQDTSAPANPSTPDSSSSDSSSSGDPSTDDIMAASIGCIATYDTILAQGKAGADTDKINDARAFAVEVYKEFSQETDDQVAADIKQADGLFPDMVAKGTTSLDEFRATCDAVFVDDGSSSSSSSAQPTI